MLKRVWGLFTNPQQEWKNIHQEDCSIGKCFFSYVLFFAAIPPVSGFIGTTQIGWRIGNGDLVKLTAESAFSLALLTYLTMLVGVFTIGKLIHWMGQTYGANQELQRCVSLAVHTATPLFVIGIMGLYPVLWLNVLIGLPAMAYTVYLLYTGVPIMMEISEERGFLFSSAVLGVGLVSMVAILAATVVIWDVGLGPVFTH